MAWVGGRSCVGGEAKRAPACVYRKDTYDDLLD